eukprot:757215-Hanusia_phi.AAC.6
MLIFLCFPRLHLTPCTLKCGKRGRYERREEEEEAVKRRYSHKQQVQQEGVSTVDLPPLEGMARP